MWLVWAWIAEKALAREAYTWAHLVGEGGGGGFLAFLPGIGGLFTRSLNLLLEGVWGEGWRWAYRLYGHNMQRLWGLNRPRHSHPQNHAIRSSPGCVGMVGGGGWSLHMELIAVGVGVCGWNAVFVIICNQCLKLPFLKMQNEPLLSLFFRRSVQ